MPDVSGTCASKLQSQTLVTIPGHDNHQIGVITTIGKHSSPGSPWNDAILTYVGTADLINGNGKQNGYFHNAHPNGDTSSGTFEATVTAVDGTMRIEGQWDLTEGTGGLAIVKGTGRFEAKMTSLTDSEMTWSGTYDL
jgi:hypothetical protein